MTTATLVNSFPKSNCYNYEDYKNKLKSIQVLEVYKVSKFKYEWSNPVTGLVNVDYLFDYQFTEI